MIVRGSDGAPYIYPSKANYNIITEFYNCVNIPFRSAYAKRYENCELFVDLYEDNIENVSPSFEKEFREPLLVKNCVFVDRGSGMKTNHPSFHRPIVFEGCRFSNVNMKKMPVSSTMVNCIME